MEKCKRSPFENFGFMGIIVSLISFLFPFATSHFLNGPWQNQWERPTTKQPQLNKRKQSSVMHHAKDETERRPKEYSNKESDHTRREKETIRRAQHTSSVLESGNRLITGILDTRKVTDLADRESCGSTSNMDKSVSYLGHDKLFTNPMLLSLNGKDTM